MKTKLLLLLTVLVLSFSTAASEVSDPDYYTIKTAEISYEGTFSDTTKHFKLMEAGGVGEVLLTIEKIIAIGEKVSELIEKNKPVVNVHLVPYYILPRSMEMRDMLYSMYEWSYPVMKIYRVEYKNLYNMPVAALRFGITYQYNGTNDGKGRYIGALKIVPLSVSCAWGFEIDAASELVSISNIGTKEAPVAEATLLFTHKVKSVLREIQSESFFSVDGLGNLRVQTK